MRVGMTMGGFRAVVLAICFLFLTLPHAAARAAEDPYREVSLALGQGLVALFPAAEGYVVSVVGRDVWIDLAEKDLLRPGMELQVYRPGEPMVHPVSGQLLGTLEKTLGQLRLTEVREKYSRGLLDGEAGGIVAGDRVRVSARRLVALLHLAGAAPGVEPGPLALALAGRAAESGRFTVHDEPAWAAHLPAGGPSLESADAEALRRLGERTAADLLLLVRISAEGVRPAVALSVRSLRTGAVVGELREPWPAAFAPPAPPAAAAPQLPAAPAAPGAPAPAEEYVIRELPRAALHLAAGDLAGEGRTAIVLSDGRGITLYRWEEQRLAWIWDEEGRASRRIVSLDAGDADGDGRPELLVTVADRGRIRSEFRSWRAGTFETLATADGLYLRFAGRPAAGAATLLGQHAGVGEVFAGRVEEYRLREGRVERVEGSALPRPAGLFGLALPPGPGPAAAFALDRSGHLAALGAGGATLWRSSRPYGGYPLLAEPRDLFGAGVLDETAFEEEARAFQGRLLAEPDPAGVRLAVPRNFSDSPALFVRQRSSGQGQIVLLAGEPSSLEELLRSRTFDGYIADLGRADVDRDGRAELLFVVNRRSGLFSDRGRLVLWRLPGRR